MTSHSSAKEGADAIGGLAVLKAILALDIPQLETLLTPAACGRVGCPACEVDGDDTHLNNDDGSECAAAARRVLDVLTSPITLPPHLSASAQSSSSATPRELLLRCAAEDPRRSIGVLCEAENKVEKEGSGGSDSSEFSASPAIAQPIASFEGDWPAVAALFAVYAPAAPNAICFSSSGGTSRCAAVVHVAPHGAQIHPRYLPCRHASEVDDDDDSEDEEATNNGDAQYPPDTNNARLVADHHGDQCMCAADGNTCTSFPFALPEGMPEPRQGTARDAVYWARAAVLSTLLAKGAAAHATVARWAAAVGAPAAPPVAFSLVPPPHLLPPYRRRSDRFVRPSEATVVAAAHSYGQRVAHNTIFCSPSLDAFSPFRRCAYCEEVGGIGGKRRGGHAAAAVVRERQLALDSAAATAAQRRVVAAIVSAGVAELITHAAASGYVFGDSTSRLVPSNRRVLEAAVPVGTVNTNAAISTLRVAAEDVVRCPLVEERESGDTTDTDGDGAEVAARRGGRFPNDSFVSADSSVARASTLFHEAFTLCPRPCEVLWMDMAAVFGREQEVPTASEVPREEEEGTRAGDGTVYYASLAAAVCRVTAARFPLPQNADDTCDASDGGGMLPHSSVMSTAETLRDFICRQTREAYRYAAVIGAGLVSALLRAGVDHTARDKWAGSGHPAFHRAFVAACAPEPRSAAGSAAARRVRWRRRRAAERRRRTLFITTSSDSVMIGVGMLVGEPIAGPPVPDPHWSQRLASVESDARGAAVVTLLRAYFSTLREMLTKASSDEEEGTATGSADGKRSREEVAAEEGSGDAGEEENNENEEDEDEEGDGTHWVPPWKRGTNRPSLFGPRGAEPCGGREERKEYSPDDHAGGLLLFFLYRLAKDGGGLVHTGAEGYSGEDAFLCDGRCGEEDGGVFHPSQCCHSIAHAQKDTYCCPHKCVHCSPSSVAADNDSPYLFTARDPPPPTGDGDGNRGDGNAAATAAQRRHQCANAPQALRLRRFESRVCHVLAYLLAPHTALSASAASGGGGGAGLSISGAAETASMYYPFAYLRSLRAARLLLDNGGDPLALIGAPTPLWHCHPLLLSLCIARGLEVCGRDGAARLRRRLQEASASIKCAANADAKDGEAEWFTESLRDRWLQRFGGSGSKAHAFAPKAPIGKTPAWGEGAFAPKPVPSKADEEGDDSGLAGLFGRYATPATTTDKPSEVTAAPTLATYKAPSASHVPAASLSYTKSRITSFGHGHGCEWGAARIESGEQQRPHTAFTPLHQAASSGSAAAAECVRVLLNCGPNGRDSLGADVCSDVHIRDDQGRLPIDCVPAAAPAAAIIKAMLLTAMGDTC